MNNEELKKLLADPKRLLDLFRLIHQLLHYYDKMEADTKPGNIESVGLADKLDIQLTKGQEVK